MFIKLLIYFLLSFIVGYLTVSALLVENKPLGFIILEEKNLD